MDIAKKIKDEKKLYEDTELELNPSFAPTQPDLLKMLDYYYSSKYVESDVDPQGDLKPFINKMDVPAIVASKQTDIDVKNVSFKTEQSNDYRNTWLLGKQFRIWAKESKFSKILNDLVWNLPRYGTVMVKKVGDRIEIPNLRNVRVDPTISGTNPPVTETHRLSLSEFIKQAEDSNWEDWKDVVKMKQAKGENFVDVLERHGELEDGDKNFVVGVLEKNKSDEEVFYKLGDGKIDFPYKSHNMEDVYGRWLGRSVGEKLLQTQIAANETEYYFRKGLKWTSLRIFQSRDNTLRKNILNAVENGDILQVMDEITPVATEERNLGAFSYADRKWDVHANNRSFSSDIVRGQRPSAGVPYSTSALQAKMAGNYFGFVQENLAIFLKELIKDWIIPIFKKERNKELLISELSNDEVQVMRKLLSGVNYRKRRAKFMKDTMRLPNIREATILRDISDAVERKRGSLPIPDEIYENLSYKITIDITGEMIDTQQKIAMAQMVINILGSNPQVMNDPRTKRAINKVLDWAGLSPTGIMDTEEMEGDRMVPLERGGSIAKPQGGQTAGNTIQV